jgi:hypothetical protein
MINGQLPLLLERVGVRLFVEFILMRLPCIQGVYTLKLFSFHKHISTNTYLLKIRISKLPIKEMSITTPEMTKEKVMRKG